MRFSSGNTTPPFPTLPYPGKPSEAPEKGRSQIAKLPSILGPRCYPGRRQRRLQKREGGSRLMQALVLHHRFYSNLPASRG